MTEPEAQGPSPVWPKPEEIDPHKVVLAYDRDSDMLLVHFDERGPASAVDYVDRLFALLVDVESGDVVGLQVEDFLARAVVEEPRRIDVLDIAELRGITPLEVAALRNTMAVEPRKRAAVASLLADLAARRTNDAAPTAN